MQGDFSGSRHTVLHFGILQSAPQLNIEIDYSDLAGNAQGNIGVDNIRFGQDPGAVTPPLPDTPLPEPSGASLVDLGLLALGAVQRLKLFRKHGSNSLEHALR